MSWLWWFFSLEKNVSRNRCMCFYIPKWKITLFILNCSSLETNFRNHKLKENLHGLFFFQIIGSGNYMFLAFVPIKKWLKFPSRYPISSPLLVESHSTPFTASAVWYVHERASRTISMLQVKWLGQIKWVMITRISFTYLWSQVSRKYYSSKNPSN